MAGEEKKWRHFWPWNHRCTCVGSSSPCASHGPMFMTVSTALFVLVAARQGRQEGPSWLCRTGALGVLDVGRGRAGAGAGQGQGQGRLSFSAAAQTTPKLDGNFDAVLSAISSLGGGMLSGGPMVSILQGPSGGCLASSSFEIRADMEHITEERHPVQLSQQDLHDGGDAVLAGHRRHRCSAVQLDPCCVWLAYILAAPSRFGHVKATEQRRLFSWAYECCFCAAFACHACSRPALAAAGGTSISWETTAPVALRFLCECHPR